MEYSFTVIERDLKQIADMLLLNGTLIECPGLIHGKMGIAIFFFHYAQYTNNSLFADYGMDLLVEIQDQVHANSRPDYEKGITGIGIGIDYLERYKFLNVKEDMFEDLDQRMYRAVMSDPWQNFSCYEGLTGYGKYWISRLRRHPLSVQAQECLMYITKQMKENWGNISLEEQAEIYCFFQDLNDITRFEISHEFIKYCREKLTDIGLTFHRLGESLIADIVRMYKDRY
ncbi:MAG: hypothetical protein LIP05_09510 [Tannerellaceae bacterium]|nr:hypothetical protein [Tannerellaceae bacterium]